MEGIMRETVQSTRIPGSYSCHPSVYASCIDRNSSHTGSQTRTLTESVSMVKRIREQSQIVAGIAVVTSLIMIPVLFYGSYEAINSMTAVEKENTTFKAYGGSQGLFWSTLLIGVMEFFHLFGCYKMYCWLKAEDALFVRLWLKWSVALTCFYGVLGTWVVVLLFVANAYGPAVGALITLIIILPTKIISNLIVFQYHRKIVPDHFWGTSMRIFETEQYISCEPVFHTPRNKDTIVIVS